MRRWIVGLAVLAVGCTQNQGPCLTEPVDTEALYSLHFLEAVAANYSGAPDPARSALARALAIRPGQAFDDSYQPELPPRDPTVRGVRVPRAARPDAPRPASARHRPMIAMPRAAQ